MSQIIKLASHTKQ